ncbi:hypothetical protein ACIOUF_06045 [Pseudomonas iridis]|uniref:Apea-like HEPN domain-containing protein n=1 Tax=Pseudomonas iridis TaxID=2710587 RepID=A0ABW8DFD6_9PSED
MRLAVLCHQCCFNPVEPQERPYPTYIEFRDDNRYEFTCEKGHKTITLLQQQKFELLFQIGAYAILDGYYREAVASFTSSLERFYEFFIKAKLLEDECPPDSLDAAWKTVSSQSERQLGAFVFLYMQSFKHPPTLLHPTKVTFRNEVIHKGKIPSREEAQNYGQAVLDIIRPILAQTKLAFPKGVQLSLITHMLGGRPNPRNELASTYNMPTIVSILSAGEGGPQKTLIEEIESLTWWRSRWN